MTELDLRSGLRALGARIESEPTPDVVAAVVKRLPAAPARSSRRWVRPVAITFALLLLGAATAVAASDTVRSWLHARGIDVSSVETLPATLPVETIADLGLGISVEASEATTVLGHPLPASSILGTPIDLLVGSEGNERTVTLVWAATSDLPAGAAIHGIGAILTIAPDRDPNAALWFGKALGGQTNVVFVGITGVGKGVWISGAPHAVTMFDGSEVRFRLATNVLVWSDGADVLRLETALGRDEAIAIAKSLDG